MSVASGSSEGKSDQLECDLILKGGITSGVVFPRVITELAEKYRFVNIGGTSAGAIGAVMAAAAEYRRQTAQSPADIKAGFDLIDRIPEELGTTLAKLFQPSPEMAPLFKIGSAVFKAKNGKLAAFLKAAVLSFGWPLVAALPGLAFALWRGVVYDIEGVILGVMVAACLLVLTLSWFLWRRLTIALPQNDFGVCSGLSQPGASQPAFTNWMANTIDSIAGREPGGDRPLTIGDLENQNIHLAAMTTDLASQRPYQLPFGDQREGDAIHQIHMFRVSEFEKLFPPNIVRHLQRGQKVTGLGVPDDLHHLPPRADLPVILVARMSLSFPGLISAIPLYRHDPTLKSGNPISRCLFSDGGITSNFPIHFFDGLLPGRPTFGISLGSYETDRDKSHSSDSREHRVDLPKGALSNVAMPVRPVTTLSGFAGSIVDTARNWQDNLQSQLNGYRERIITVKLDDSKEGGLNLEMDKATIDLLASLGAYAGQKIRTDFDFDNHRRLRAITALPIIANALGVLSDRYDVGHYKTLLAMLPAGLPASISGKMTAADVDRLADFAEKLAAVGNALGAAPLTVLSQQRADLRVMASTDTVPPALQAPSK